MNVELYTYLPTKMEQIECSETSAYKIQTPGNYPEESVEQNYCCSYCRRWGSYHRSGIPVVFDGVLEHLLVGIEFRAI